MEVSGVERVAEEGQCLEVGTGRGGGTEGGGAEGVRIW
jgi:hypothetical protein